MATDPVSRAPAEVRRTGNRLAQQASLYLRQHAANPVDWHPWDDEALALARRSNRPIFLSSGYSSCHWCHVMEREVFEHDDIAALLNQHFVSIKVDREEQPVVDATYMEAVQRLTGRGGWPMSVFLTPELDPFFGGTYFPHSQFQALITQIAELWRSQPDELVAQARQLAAGIRTEPETSATGALDADLLPRAVARAGEAFDPEHGGFRAPMKFPVPVRWTFLLHWFRKTGDAGVRRMLVTTLEAMARGGLYDHVGGGFHRYTVDADWTVPHFEKMLYDNAQLASLYLEAGVALDRPDWTAVAVDVLEFLDREMTGPEGCVHASLDADSDGEEGSYYVWTPAELAEAVGPDDGAVLASLLDVRPEGTFERGTSVVTRRVDPAVVSARHGRTQTDVEALFAHHRDRLREVRDRRPRPAQDRKVITAWNGLALTAFARAAQLTGREDFRARAIAIAEGLDRVHRRSDGRLARASDGGRVAGEATLEDYALLGRGLLELFQLTGDVATLIWLNEIINVVREDHARDEGGWYTASSAASAAAPLGRRVELIDQVIPSGSSAMLDLLLAHATLTADTSVRDEVTRELASRSRWIEAAGLEMAGWLDVALRLAGPRYEVVLAGERGDEAFEALWQTAVRSLPPGSILVPVPAQGVAAAVQELAPVLGGKEARAGNATAFVCEEGTCHDPVTVPAELAVRIRRGWTP